jgi:hypothetical protein
MTDIDRFQGWNAEAVANAQRLYARGQALSERAARLRENGWAIVFSGSQRAEQRGVLQDAADLERDVGARDLDGRVDPGNRCARFESRPSEPLQHSGPSRRQTVGFAFTSPSAVSTSSTGFLQSECVHSIRKEFSGV